MSNHKEKTPQFPQFLHDQEVEGGGKALAHREDANAVLEELAKPDTPEVLKKLRDAALKEQELIKQRNLEELKRQ